MVATESDAKSFEYASRNVSRNGLEDRIKVAKVESGGKGDPLVPESVLKRFERWVPPCDSNDIDLQNSSPPPNFRSEKEIIMRQMVLTTLLSSPQTRLPPNQPPVLFLPPLSPNFRFPQVPSPKLHLHRLRF